MLLCRYLFGESQPSDSADSSKGNIDFRAVNGTAVVRIGLLDAEDVITYFSRNTLSEVRHIQFPYVFLHKHCKYSVL